MGPPTDPGLDAFPGLYPLSQLLARPFLDATHIIVTSLWHHRTTLLNIDLVSGTAVNLTPSPDHTSWKVLDLRGRYLLAAYEAFHAAPKLMVGRVDVATDVGCHGAVAWRPVQRTAVPDDDIFGWLGYNIVTETAFLHEDPPCEVLFLTQRDTAPYKGAPQDKLPLIVSAHGGPHVAFNCAYSPLLAGFLALGYSLVLVNYAGSAGYGDKALKSLLGRIGELDIAHVHVRCCSSRMPSAMLSPSRP